MATPRICSVEGCGKPARGREFCRMHYARWLRNGDTDRHRKRKMCSIEGCGRPAFGHGWCSKHYQRWARNGDPLTAGRTPEGEPLKWLEDHLKKESDECFPWPFARNKAGYGIMASAAGSRVVSRMICERTHGPAPYAEADTAHSCNNPPCCNKRHVRWDTRAGNMADAIERGTTLRGKRHPLSKLNDEAVREIRSLDGVVTQQELSLRYSVSRSLISFIQSGKKWSWLLD